ncbi:MAG: LOG family protein [Nanoarchaeota archaeon]|nr:LOG family protein [Nanoarchaeota archaeon]
MKLKGNFKKELKKDRFRVSIFGSSRIKKDDRIYKQVHQLAKMLGERGIDVITGGGPGIMEAANLGHNLGSKQTKAKSFGLNIFLPHEQKLNKGVQVEKRFKRFSQRLDNFMLLSNAVVVAQGGVGTMLELFYVWQVLQVKNIRHIPVILMGKQWIGLLEWLRDEPLARGYFNKNDFRLLFHADDLKEVIKIINAAHDQFKQGKGKDFVLKY